MLTLLLSGHPRAPDAFTSPLPPLRRCVSIVLPQHIVRFCARTIQFLQHSCPLLFGHELPISIADAGSAELLNRGSGFGRPPFATLRRGSLCAYLRPPLRLRHFLCPFGKSLRRKAKDSLAAIRGVYQWPVGNSSVMRNESYLQRDSLIFRKMLAKFGLWNRNAATLKLQNYRVFMILPFRRAGFVLKPSVALSHADVEWGKTVLAVEGIDVMFSHWHFRNVSLHGYGVK